MTLRVVQPGESEVRIHRCRICGHQGPWTRDWAWFGSLRDYDERPSRLVLVCSAACKAEAEARGMAVK